ncbi:MAG TPA: 16S rRNA (guanine(966)-N(2))-methyltransferase RsmD [Mesotoga sp.]|jgi:16S rRNA (guanine(966)-N(2))-methyltransferase RsmD|uniref:16S rRNA (guanine(966)-N(2))-methyltransferase RsmD n=1 Tax=unclassified Mesotoga TaxID=1184398 RepID=UPI000B234F17|nr:MULTISPECIES: 16S rRNA (guanine(966)-N(2))-methyltransferase RsmD [unclassified Mesotoga]PNQ06051.1 hypothetical protein RM69_01710 [Mesotoga sp. SC_NapDC3]PXF35326.1 hypothetical protein EU77_02330 [Mesotoga sp. SC_NapDC]RAM60754.1 hypothetical protein DS67_07260 [Mesotoga sp. SC_4PWA21]RIZ61517.1 hypothetical protein KU43_02200 [Mesotoga sp. SC_NapDC2]MDD3459776.1 16S rRNA (guanine(966)-N(2))-methyltransferase RsmD [Mesotoga sp.]
MLVITGGKWARRSIKTPPRRSTRYTPQSARKALFDIVDVSSKTFLDLFSGSGIISFEALSRGAIDVTSVDSSKKACQSILESKNGLDPSADLKIVCSDFRRAIPSLVRKGVEFDIIFADPPFDEQYIKPLIELLEQNSVVLNSRSLLIVETSKRESDSLARTGTLFRLIDQREYAGIVFSIMVKK